MATVQIKSAINDFQALVDSTGHLYVTGISGGIFDNSSVGPGGSTAPVNATEIAGINNLGNLTPLMLNSSSQLIVADNSSIGMGGATAPSNVTEVGGINNLGNLQAFNLNSLGQLVTSATGTFQPVGLQTEGIITMVTIDNSAWYLAPPSPLLNRNNIQVQNPSTSTSDIIWNYNNTAPLTAGLHIPPGASYSVAIKGSIPVYLTAAAPATIICPVEELE